MSDDRTPDEKVYTHAEFMERVELTRTLSETQVELVTQVARPSVEAAKWRQEHTCELMFVKGTQVTEPTPCELCGSEGDPYAAAKNYPNGLTVHLPHEHRWWMEVRHTSSLPRQAAICRRCFACALVTLADNLMRLHPDDVVETVEDVEARAKGAFKRLLGDTALGDETT